MRTTPLKRTLRTFLVVFFAISGGLAFARFPNSDYYGIAFDFGIFPEETLKVKRSVYGITLSPLVLDTADVRRIGVNGSLWIMSIESTGLGVSVIHWEDCVKGLQVGLLSAGALDVDGLQVGFVTGFGVRTYQQMPALPQVRGGQIGVFNLAEWSWFQLGGYNSVIDVCGAQIGLLNYSEAEYSRRLNPFPSIQFGFFNIVSSRKHFFRKTKMIQFGLVNSIKTSNVQPNGVLLQFGLINSVKASVVEPVGTLLQFGLINRTQSGWWLPISNFGL